MVGPNSILHLDIFSTLLFFPPHKFAPVASGMWEIHPQTSSWVYFLLLLGEEAGRLKRRALFLCLFVSGLGPRCVCALSAKWKIEWALNCLRWSD